MHDYLLHRYFLLLFFSCLCQTGNHSVKFGKCQKPILPMNLPSLSFGERPIHFPPGGLDSRPCIVQLSIEGHRGERLEAAEKEEKEFLLALLPWHYSIRLESAHFHFLLYIALASKNHKKRFPIRKADELVDKMHFSGQNKSCVLVFGRSAKKIGKLLHLTHSIPF